MRIEVRPAIPGEQSAQWRCTEGECTGIWHVAWETGRVWEDGKEHAVKVHDVPAESVWFHTEAASPPTSRR